MKGRKEVGKDGKKGGSRIGLFSPSVVQEYAALVSAWTAVLLL